MSKVTSLKTVVKQVDTKELVDGFLAQCEAQGRSKDTIRSHGYALKFFFELYGDRDLNDHAAIKRTITSLFKDRKDAYYNKQLNAIRQFFDYLLDKGTIIIDNPATDFKYRRPTVQIVDHSENNIKAFLRIMDKETFAGLRDYAFAILILDTGIRPNEALQLRPDDIEFDSKMVRVRREYAKTRKERYVPVSTQVLQVFKKLIAVRPEDWKADVPILCTYDGHRFPTRGMQDRFRDYGRMTNTNITPYHLRHVFGVNYIRNKGDAFSLQAIMGHEKLEMTRVYVNLARTDIQENHSKASPLVNMMSNKRVKNLK